nr:hypothetical protein [Tanacetum cinerariifolium]
VLVWVTGGIGAVGRDGRGIDEDLIESAFNSKLLLINSQHLDKKKQEVKNVVEQPTERGNLAPILSTKEPEHPLSMGYEHLSITPETESDEVTESNAKNLLPIPSECEVTSEDKRDFYDDDFEDIGYVEAPHSGPEIVSVKEENDVNQEEEDVDLEDISQIQDVVLREKLLSITRLISNIESLNDNPTTDYVLNSFKSDNSLSNTFSPEFKTFCDYTEETRSSSTTTHADDSLPEDLLLEEADLFLAFDNLIPSGIENVADDSKGDVFFLEELLIDDSILSHESPNSNFEDNLSIP